MKDEILQQAKKLEKDIEILKDHKKRISDRITYAKGQKLEMSLALIVKNNQPIELGDDALVIPAEKMLELYLLKLDAMIIDHESQLAKL